MAKENGSRIITPRPKLSMRELQRMIKSLEHSLKWMSVRCQLVACELHKVDDKNDIFKLSEGVLDREHLFHVRKALKTGQYEKNRDICRIPTKRNPDLKK